MHKGYKCLDRSTGRIYISRDVVFDETVFPFATPGVVVDVSSLHPVSFPAQEPAIQGPNMRKYDMSLLSFDVPGISCDFPVQAQVPMTGAIDVPAQPASDVHATPMHASSSEPREQPSPSAAPDSPPGMSSSPSGHGPTSPDQATTSTAPASVDPAQSNSGADDATTAPTSLLPPSTPAVTRR